MEEFIDIDNLIDVYPNECERLQNELKSLKRKLELVDLSDMDRKVSKTEWKCDVCDKVCDNKSSLTSHVLSHKITHFQCEMCARIFRRKDCLDNHIRKKHSQSGLGKKHNLPRSSSSQPSEQDSNVNTSHIPVDHNYTTLMEQRAPASSSATDHTYSQPASDGQYSAETDHSYSQKSALNATILDRTIEPHSNEKYDMLTFFANVKPEVERFLKSRASQTGIKWYLSIQVELVKDSEDQQLVVKPHFRSRTYVTLNIQIFDEHELNESFQKMFESFEKYIRESSGWVLKKVVSLTIHTILYKPLKGSSFIELPKKLRRLQSLLNIRNVDQKCFLWSCLASIHQSESPLIDEYKQYEHELDMKGISFPFPINQLNLFENQNPSISVNVFGFEDGDVLPVRITKQKDRLHHIDLLLLQTETNSHYVLIKNFNAFLSSVRKHHNQLYFCPYCLHGFNRQALLDDHITYCQVNGEQRVELPTHKNCILEFKDYEKTLRVPYVIYADFETLNKPLDQVPRESITQTHLLEPCSFAYKVVSTDSEYQKDTVIYRGHDASQRLLDCLLRECDDIQKRLQIIKPLHLSQEEEDLFQNADRCCLCETLFEDFDTKVRHHDHTTGQFIGATHSNCNLQCKQVNFIPVVFHNLKNFDAHLLCQSIGTFKDEKITCIGQTLEKYISFSIGKLRFIDSFQFLSCSLAELVDDLAEEGHQSFTYFQNEIKDHTELLLRKGVYPYEYMDDFSKFEETCLPPKEMFYSSLTKEDISDELYNHAQKVYSTCECQNLGDYHDLYLKTDVLLLADVFEQFRTTSHKCYGLDVLHYYTLPNYSSQAMLKHTKVKLELLTDVTMVNFIEKSIRGGLSQISNRYAKANNKYVGDYDASKETSYLAYIDCNNLYGFCMSRDKLCSGSFYFLTSEEIEKFDIHQVPEDGDVGDVGYILEVDLEYPSHLHDEHNDFPLAPERKFIPNEKLSPYAKSMWKKLHKPTKKKNEKRKKKQETDKFPPRANVEKLLTTLENKDHYILHYRNLKLYLQLGMKLKKIHKILEFRQEAFMKSYVDFNTKRRQEAKTTFERNLMKLYNNSCFGKTMENVRRHRTIELCHREGRLMKLAAKPSYKCHRIFNEDLVGVELSKRKVKLNKPIYIGATILDLSKRLMYDFYYNHLKKVYGNNVQLQFTDTDSFLFHWKCDDIFQEMAAHAELYDTSNFPKDHFLHSNVNKKVMGKMKSETGAKCISEFCGLRSKMYAFKCGKEEDKRAKGIAKTVVEKELQFNDYKATLFNETQMKSEMCVIRSHDHQIYCEKFTKTGLSCFDDKRYLLNDGISSLAYGHYKINQQ